jgi:hypothetical protein
MDPFFFRVEHDLLRSEAFKDLGGSAIKVYLVIGLYADFDTGWAYPSIRTIARQAGLSRQTVLAALAELTGAGLLASRKSQGRTTAYQIVRQAPPARGPKGAKKSRGTVPDLLEGPPKTVPDSLVHPRETVPDSLGVLARFLGLGGPADGPKREPLPRREEDSAPAPTIEIPGTPFRLTADGRLLVSVDLQELLTDQGLPRRLAERLASQRAPEDVAKVLLNAFYLQSQGKLQNGPGYIRAGLEDGYELLPQVANRLETRRKELQQRLQGLESQRLRRQHDADQDAEEEAIRMVLDQVDATTLDHLVARAVAALPAPLVRRNPTLSNPFVRAKVYELAGGEPIA